MSDTAPETEPVVGLIDLLEAVHDFGGLVVGLAEHHAARMLRDVAARPESAEREELLGRLREMVMQHEYDAITAMYAAPDGRAKGAGSGGFSDAG
jgi:hypothetical protein